MNHHRSNRGMSIVRSVWTLATLLPLVAFGPTDSRAQSMMRPPNLNVGSRVPTINPSVTPRINPSINVRPSDSVDRIARTRPDQGAEGVSPTPPAARLSAAGGGKGTPAKKGSAGPKGNNVQAALNQRTVRNELVAEIDGALSTAQADALARRHGLERIASQNFPLLGSTIGLFRIVNSRPADTVRRAFAADGSVRSVQQNFRYVLQEQKAGASVGDAAQYASTQLRLPQAHALVRGMNVTIAVIDSGVDVRHPELANSVADSFDALGSREGPHTHGTGVAGAIVAHAKLTGSAPEARLLAIRAFGSVSKGAESTTWVILRGLDYAVAHGAQIINMSFAGPKDPVIEKGIAATAARGILMVAAAGNAGAKSPPLYPAANPNVVAVSGTDAQDRLFAASNRGSHIALAAPGADILLPAPDDKYQITSGTSFAAAYVSGVAALMLERNPALKPGDIRSLLAQTARDLGAPGRDDQFGAGEADAFAAVTAAAAPAVPLASAGGKPAKETSPPRDPSADNSSVSRALDEPSPSMAADKSAANAAK